MSDKPTGVFVGLPLSGEEASTIRDHIMSQILTTDALEHTLHAIGAPVTGGELEVVAYINPREKSSPNVAFRPFHDYLPLVRQSDAQAQIAARDAEIVRLREENEALKELAKAGRDYLKYCSAVVKGGAA